MIPGETIFRLYADLSRRLTGMRSDILNQVDTIHAIYDPLEYADRPWRAYLERFCTGPRRVLLLGMNPGPWGMAQTGIPFGEISAVQDWMGIREPVDRPRDMHPDRPVEGFECSRSEVSGRRLWALMQQRFGSAEDFFRDHAVLNFCPLVFMGENGRNITPDKLPVTFRRPLEDACREALIGAIGVLGPEYLVGIGRFARDRLAQSRNALANGDQTRIAEPIQILHPSPASPAANRGWAATVTAQLEEAGVW